MIRMKPKNSSQAKASTVNRKNNLWAVFVGGLSLAVGACLLARPTSSPKPTAVAPVVRGESINSPPPSDPAATRNDLAAGQPPKNTLPTNSMASPAVVSAQAQGDYLTIGFDKLSGFVLTLTNQIVDPVAYTSVLKIAGTIPDSVQSLGEKKVALKGFMLPVKLEGGRVTEFILLKSRTMCCFGVPPKMNEWVSVRMAGKGERVTMDQPVVISGTFHVGEIRRDGLPAGIYRLDGEKMDVPVSFP